MSLGPESVTALCSQLQGLNMPETEDIYAEVSFAVPVESPLSKWVWIGVKMPSVTTPELLH